VVKVDDKKLCPRYTARIIHNVKVGESPSWLKKKIEAMGLRPVNNIVDITNFCLLETGEPMHAFDLNNLAGNTVIIRKAARGEKITIIDGTERLLDESMLVEEERQIDTRLEASVQNAKKAPFPAADTLRDGVFYETP